MQNNKIVPREAIHKTHVVMFKLISLKDVHVHYPSLQCIKLYDFCHVKKTYILNITDYVAKCIYKIARSGVHYFRKTGKTF